MISDPNKVINHLRLLGLRGRPKAHKINATPVAFGTREIYLVFVRPEGPHENQIFNISHKKN